MRSWHSHSRVVVVVVVLCVVQGMLGAVEGGVTFGVPPELSGLRSSVGEFVEKSGRELVSR